MANFNAIGAVSTTLTNLIKDNYSSEFGATPEPVVHLHQTNDFKTSMAKENVDSFSVYLYRVAINGSVRNSSSKRTPEGHRFRPSLPLDLYYLITPWVTDTERQHRMLGWLMRMLEDVGTLGSSHLNHNQYSVGTNTFLATESIDIVCDPLALNDYFTIWDRLGALPLSITYVLRMVMIDSNVSIDDGKLVQTRSFDMGKVVT